MTIASAGLINRHPALLATKPPTQPLAVSEASGRPNRTPVTAKAASAEDAALSVVLMATIAICPGSACAKRIAPAEFRATQPIQTKKQANTTRTELCAGIAFERFRDEYLPRRGPMIQTTLNAERPDRKSTRLNSSHRT